MSFNPMMVKLITEAAEIIGKPGTVVEMGNQTFNGNVPGIKSTKQFYESLGFTDYKAIDVNTQHGSMMMDLNTILADEYDYHDQFDLVTNNGTGEHLFNQLAIFTNAHNLCRQWGYMLHVMPFVNWLNHGFYNFHPVLYWDVARANSYSIPIFALGNRWGDMVEISEKHIVEGKSNRYSEIADAVKHVQAIRGETNVMIITMYKKISDNPFKIPMQNKYANVIESSDIKQNYA